MVCDLYNNIKYTIRKKCQVFRLHFELQIYIYIVRVSNKYVNQNDRFFYIMK